MSDVPQNKVWKIMNKINEALEGTGYQAMGYDNTNEIWLAVYIESDDPWFRERKGKKKVVEKNG